MKFQVAGVPVEFKPLSVTITLESQDEVDAFYRAGDAVYREHPSGSITESIGIQMKQAVTDWTRNA